MVAIAPAIMSAFRHKITKKEKNKEPCKQFLPFYQESTKFSGTILEFSCDSLARRGTQGHPSCKEVGENEGQDCWDWLITWRPHITLSQIKVGLCSQEGDGQLSICHAALLHPDLGQCTHHSHAHSPCFPTPHSPRVSRGGSR